MEEPHNIRRGERMLSKESARFFQNECTGFRLFEKKKDPSVLHVTLDFPARYTARSNAFRFRLQRQRTFWRVCAPGQELQ